MVRSLLFSVILFLVLLEFSASWILNPYLEELNESLISQEITWGAKHLPLNPTDGVRADFKGKIPHPFFGFTNWQDTFERPDVLEKQHHKFRIGFFGGSVAEQLAQANQKHQILEHHLQKLIDQSKKETEFISFAVSGYRQPQSYFISAIYGEALDLTINVEGVNELNMFEEDLPPYFPMGFAANLYFRSMPELAQVPELHRRALIEAGLRRALAEKGRFAMARAYFLFLRNQNLRRMRPIGQTVDQKTPYRFHSPQKWENSYSDRFARWLKYSCLQQNLMQNYGAPSFFIIQPVPQTFKPLSKEEVVLVSQSRASEREVASFLAQVDFTPLIDSGLNLIDLRKVFSDSPETLYMDSCCHLNERGDLLLLKTISEAIQENYENGVRLCDYKKLQKHINRALGN